MATYQRSAPPDSGDGIKPAALACRMRPWLAAAIAAGFAVSLLAAAPLARRDVSVADRITALTRASSWTLERAVPMAFPAHHPQGMVKIGDRLFVSSVEVTTPPRRGAGEDGFDRDTGRGVGHLFEATMDGRLVADVVLGEGAMYHPGGLDFDGRDIWVPVAEYRPDSRSIVYRVDPRTMKPTEMFRVADHIGAIVHNTDDRTLHGVSWGSRRFYRWTLGKDGTVTNADRRPESLRTLNPSHYLDYQDCKYLGQHRMLCTGVTEMRQGQGAPPFRLGGLDLVNLDDGRPVHQVPVLLWTAGGLDMTHNPVWIEPSAVGLRAYFMPDDDRSTLYIYEVDAK